MLMQLPDSIKYIGTDDPGLDLFEAQYPVPRGVSYNSYIILDRQTAVMDTVDRRCTTQWLERLEAALDGRTPDFLVIHHMEPDHSASVAAFLMRYPGARVVAGAAALRMLGQFFPELTLSREPLTVKEGDELSLGDHVLHFIAAPMVHWPEVMMSLEKRTRTLFSADAFGTFGPAESPAEPELWKDEARRYYCNIVGKYGRQVQAVLHKLNDLPVTTIAPLHGPALTGDLAPYVGLYDAWSAYRPEEPGVLVTYASVYGGTAEAAAALAAGLRDRGVANVVETDLCRTHVSSAVAQAFRFPVIALCSATYNAGLFPAMETFLTHLRERGLLGRVYGLVENGSWAPVAGKLMADAVAALPHSTVLDPVVTIHSRLAPADLPAVGALADALRGALH